MGTAHAGDIARRNHRALASIQMPARKVQICTTPGLRRPAGPLLARNELADLRGRDGDQDHGCARRLAVNTAFTG